MKQNVVQGLLKQVSRSFYLSLRLLPGPMRDAAGLAYLLARASDTIADSARAAVELRIEALTEFSSQLAGKSPHVSWSGDLVLAVDDAGERELLNKTHRLVEWAHGMPDEEKRLIMEVLDVIISGQKLDLERFGSADAHHPVMIGNAEDLDDYTWRVAGCVGEFWTRLGHQTLGDRFSASPVDELLSLAANYGRGLQLVNILRDVPRDLNQGRCYLPVSDPRDREEMLKAHRIQLSRAMSLVQDGLAYSSRLKGRRLRMASVMPALLAEDTLSLMKDASWDALEKGVKIPRSRVYGNLMQSLFF